MLLFPRSLPDIINTEEEHIFFMPFTQHLAGRNKQMYILKENVYALFKNSCPYLVT